MVFLQQNLFAKRAFSLLEIVAAIAIIAIVLTILGMGMGNLLPLSKSKQAQVDMVRIQHALEAYKASFGEYPKAVVAFPSMEGVLFNALGGTMAPSGKLGNFPSLLDRNALAFENDVFPVRGAEPVFVANAIVDPWGKPYLYRYDPEAADWKNFHYVLFSAGPDGAFAEVTAQGYRDETAEANRDNIYAQ